ncbi:hypothetical protein [Winogradskyella sp. UBA3174]|uniref:hypothetical protein n=1 Tax=Winogradskyella sp. UBA3174 TaxID=1947785 RepID=UPI0025F3938A|nr:hypothetical protein [Winogradskyella sp. UBA3174]|tara:strand:+ start:20028 stop:20591 length:564 start_codon:yes stop_codon:yes gene_type:complete
MIHTQKYLLLILLLINSCLIHAQGEKEEAREEYTEATKKHSLGLFLTHSYINQGLSNGEKDWLIVPSFAINYNYNFNHKWSLGLHTDLIIEDFIVERDGSNDEVLEREFPFSALVVGSHKLSESFGFALGFGAEWETTESFAVARFGAEYGIEIPVKEMEVIFAFNYDVIFNAYNSFNLGIGIAKKF